jgi:2-hydroxychromene-2-carboxylate isomerase
VSAAAVEFWFDFASPYSYPAAMTIEARAAAAGRTVAWRPVTMGPIFADLGWNDSPFNLQPAKGRYMWRDMERICAAEGLPFRRPDPFPANSVAAARAALVALDHDWGPEFCRQVFRAEFAEGADIAEPSTLADLVARAGGDPARALSDAVSPDNRPRLRAAVGHARGRGIFGVPTFLVGEEMFWGFDRLDMALGWPA